MRRKGSKRLAQIRHAKGRALLRFGVTLSDQEYNDLCKQIQQSKFRHLPFRQSNRVSHFYIPLGGKEAIAVYDKQRKTIVTFMLREKDLPKLGENNEYTDILPVVS